MFNALDKGEHDIKALICRHGHECASLISSSSWQTFNDDFDAIRMLIVKSAYAFRSLLRNAVFSEFPPIFLHGYAGWVKDVQEACGCGRNRLNKTDKASYVVILKILELLAVKKGPSWAKDLWSCKVIDRARSAGTFQQAKKGGGSFFFHVHP